ncbi:mechanosensitive ion channel family protein [Cumulibacter manganitolerans]|uniref:mechanosensitive ion channel family protein n=1 Tax=Cumulibacter manganitolerans TaxID=1884992 RepID=UPI0012977164|nr:mechanosensitive ion channel family protein [Cumulibacter manganitolerans]
MTFSDLHALATETLIDANEALVTAGRIAIIVVVAVIARLLMQRAVRRLTQRSIDGKMPVMLSPLRGRARKVVVAATGLGDERRRQRAETIRSVLGSAISILVVTVASILVLGELGINLAPIVASAGIVGVALGFGAQNLVKDYLNGIFMILEDQYGVGDVVDIGEAVGTIEAVGLRTTRVRDVEGVIWYVRNGEILRVANHSQGTASVIVDMPVAHGTDLDLAQAEMRRVLDEMAGADVEKDALLSPPEVLGVQSVSAVGITLRAVLTVSPDERYRVAREAKQRISAAFTTAGISAPAVSFPGADK